MVECPVMRWFAVLLVSACGVPHSNNGVAHASRMISRNDLFLDVGPRTVRMSPDGLRLASVRVSPVCGEYVTLSNVSSIRDASVKEQRISRFGCRRVTDYQWLPGSDRLFVATRGARFSDRASFVIDMAGASIRLDDMLSNARFLGATMSDFALAKPNGDGETILIVDARTGAWTETGRSRSSVAVDRTLKTIVLPDTQREPIAETTRGTLAWGDHNHDEVGIIRSDGRVEQLVALSRGGLDRLVLDPIDNHLVAARAIYDAPQWTIVDSTVTDDITTVESAVGSDFEVASQTEDGTTWLIAAPSEQALPGATQYYLYARTPQTRLRPFPFLGASIRRAVPRAVLIPTRDAETLVSYLSEAPHSRGLVIVVHGGPFGRVKSQTTAYAELFLTRGYSVLQVNYRGSTGFGERFRTLASGEWGAKTTLDVVDAAEWAVAHGVVQPSQIAVWGESFGGFTVLSALTLAPSTFACGIDYAGWSNLEAIPNREDIPGLEPSANTISSLRERSPINHIDRLARPILVVHGEIDDVVSVAQSQMFVTRALALNKHVVLATLPNEGHVLLGASSKLMYWGLIEAFLSHCLGGSAEPLPSLGDMGLNGDLSLLTPRTG